MSGNTGLSWRAPFLLPGASATNLTLFGLTSNTPALTVAPDNFVVLGKTGPTSYPYNTFANVMLGVSYNSYAGTLVAGPDIILPDRGGLRWKDGGAIWGWANHGSVGGSLVRSSKKRKVTTSEANGCEIDESPQSRTHSRSPSA